MRRKRSVLLIENNHIDALAVKRAFEEINLPNRLVTVGNGVEALEYLRDQENNETDIILLDINMPLMNGIEFLKIAKQDVAAWDN